MMRPKPVPASQMLATHKRCRFNQFRTNDSPLQEKYRVTILNLRVEIYILDLASTAFWASSRALLFKTDFPKLGNGNALVWSQPLIFPPRHEPSRRTGPYAACLDEASAKSGPACRFDPLSSARASAAHRRNEVGFLLARASQTSSSEGFA